MPTPVGRSKTEHAVCGFLVPLVTGSVLVTGGVDFVTGFVDLVIGLVDLVGLVCPVKGFLVEDVAGFCVVTGFGVVTGAFVVVAIGCPSFL